MRRRDRIRTTALVLAVALGSGCDRPPTNSSTAEFAITGRAAVRGVVLDRSGFPRDSVEVVVGIPIGDGYGLYSGVPARTARDGSFLVTLERRGAIPPTDSIRAVLSARALRPSEVASDGTPLSVRLELWVNFARPPASPSAQEFVVTLPTPPR